MPKTELLDEIWGDRFVSESALTSRIKFARRAVGDTGRDQRFIKTVHGRGYRFVGDVEPLDAAPPVGATISNGPGAGAGASPAALVELVVGTLAGGRGVAVAVVDAAGPAAREPVDELYDEAAAHGYLVARAGVTGAGLRPYGCVIDAVDELLARRPELAETVPPACRAELERCVGGELPSTRQRLFLAVRELFVRAAELHGLVVILDDLDVAGPETIALVDHVARLARGHRIGVVSTRALAGDHGTFERLALERGVGGEAPRWDLPVEVREALLRVAVGGLRFDLLELRAAAGLDEQQAAHVVDVAIARGAAVALPGERFELTADLLAGSGDPAGTDGDGSAGALPPHRRAAIHRETAARLESLGAAPERIAEHWLAGGDVAAAVEPARRAAARAAEVHAHPEVLRWVGAVLDEAEGEERAALLALRARALSATGDASAVVAYREALAAAGPTGERRLRAELARTALFAGDFATATDVLDGVEPDGGPDDAAVMLIKALLAYFSGDLDGAESTVRSLRTGSFSTDSPRAVIDTIALQGMISHDRGEYFDRLRRELLAAGQDPTLAMTIFDSHLCVAEYLLYGPVPDREVVSLAQELRRQADEVGARRAAAFAVCVAGEAELLAGELDAARGHLEESLRLHRELGADTGTAHTLQRLAELELACGNRHEALELLREALPLARWSPLSNHLLQRTYGTLIAAQPDPWRAVDAAAEALEVVDEPDACEFCGVMVEVPVTIAFAEGGRLDLAREHLRTAEAIAARWHGTAWKGAVREARAVIAQAEGDDAAAHRLFREAADLFAQAGQVLDAERCEEAAESCKTEVV